jgi:hypothetical protein
MKGRIVDFTADMISRKQRLTLALDGDFRGQYDNMKDKDLEITVKPWREKRSLDANAYCWVLINKLAEVLNLPAREVYRHAVKQVGISRDVYLNREAAETIKHIWSAHGIGWVTEQVDETDTGIMLRLYYGSSCYNTKQMHRLIEFVQQDCREFGIETKTPEELALLLDDWEKKQEVKKND